MAFWNRNRNELGLRVIKTARDEMSINIAARSGFRPLVKKVVPSDKISSKYSVVQNKKTGEIRVLGDFREYMGPDFETVIGWTGFYPYSFPSRFAAYLIPEDLIVGERVFIEDLIEDFVGASWNQGDAYRLESCEAIWNGTDLEIQYDPGRHQSQFIG